jgi:hypothetical protein
MPEITANTNADRNYLHAIVDSIDDEGIHLMMRLWTNRSSISPFMNSPMPLQPVPQPMQSAPQQSSAEPVVKRRKPRVYNKFSQHNVLKTWLEQNHVQTGTPVEEIHKYSLERGLIKSNSPIKVTMRTLTKSQTTFHRLANGNWVAKVMLQK